eukprot:gene9441-1647_t
MEKKCLRTVLKNKETLEDFKEFCRMKNHLHHIIFVQDVIEFGKINSKNALIYHATSILDRFERNDENDEFQLDIQVIRLKIRNRKVDKKIFDRLQEKVQGILAPFCCEFFSEINSTEMMKDESNVEDFVLPNTFNVRNTVHEFISKIFKQAVSFRCRTDDHRFHIWYLDSKSTEMQQLQSDDTHHPERSFYDAIQHYTATQYSFRSFDDTTYFSEMESQLISSEVDIIYMNSENKLYF